MKAELKQHNYIWTFEAMSFEHAMTIATEKYNRMGLIGRAYLYTGDGRTGQINN